jgi:hypothetical protein
MEVGTAHRTPKSRCTACGETLDGAAAVAAIADDAAPSPGDITVCVPCGHLMAFDDALKLRELTDDEMRAIAGDRRILAIQRARSTI